MPKHSRSLLEALQDAANEQEFTDYASIDVGTGHAVVPDPDSEQGQLLQAAILYHKMYNAAFECYLSTDRRNTAKLNERFESVLFNLSFDMEQALKERHKVMLKDAESDTESNNAGDTPFEEQKLPF